MDADTRTIYDDLPPVLARYFLRDDEDIFPPLRFTVPAFPTFNLRLPAFLERDPYSMRVRMPGGEWVNEEELLAR